MTSGDQLGPQYIIKVYNPQFQVWGFLVIDNTKRGPGKGGIRMTSTVSEEEVARLARAMTWKNTLANIPFGGAKAGIAFDPRAHSPQAKKKVVEWFAKALKSFIPKLYIAGPDINMAEADMATFAKAVGSRQAATGKPKRLGGLPHELGSTGYGVAEAVRLALEAKSIPLAEATVAIEGFGNVGVFAAQFLTEMGLKVVAVSDSRGAIYEPSGLDFKKLTKTKAKAGTVTAYPGAKVLKGAELFTLPVTVLIPAALPDVITEQNVDEIKAQVIVEGANIAVTQAAEAKLNARGVLIIPDIVANAGGVISSYAEFRGWSAERMFKLVKEKITGSVSRALVLHKKSPAQTIRELVMAEAAKLLN